MSAPQGAPFVPDTIEGLLIQIQRRLNEAENRERGAGRRGWNEAVITLPGASVLDNGFPAWRALNDGRIELRGRLNILGSLAAGTQVLRLSGRAAPHGDGGSYKSWCSMLAPCASSGANPGVVRLDVERYIVPEAGGDRVFYTKIIAMPPVDRPLTGWIGFDHASYDPNLYIDAVSTVPASYLDSVFGRGVRRDDGEYIVAHRPGEFGIAFLGNPDGTKVSIVPGQDANPQPPPHQS